MGWTNSSGYCFGTGDIVEDAENPSVNGKVVAITPSGSNLVIVRSDGRGWPKELHDYTQHLPEGTTCWHVSLDDVMPLPSPEPGFKVGDFICDKSSDNALARVLLVDSGGDYLTERSDGMGWPKEDQKISAQLSDLPEGTKCWWVLKKDATMSTQPWQKMSFVSTVRPEIIVPLLSRAQAEMRSARGEMSTFDSIRLQLLRDL